jgi:hypothetical protein
MVAEKVGGRLVLFNPIIGQKREFDDLSYRGKE